MCWRQRRRRRRLPPILPRKGLPERHLSSSKVPQPPSLLFRSAVPLQKAVHQRFVTVESSSRSVPSTHGPCRFRWRPWELSAEQHQPIDAYICDGLPESAGSAWRLSMHSDSRQQRSARLQAAIHGMLLPLTSLQAIRQSRQRLGQGLSLLRNIWPRSSGPWTSSRTAAPAHQTPRTAPGLLWTGEQKRCDHTGS